MAKYELTFTVQPLAVAAPPGMRDDPDPSKSYAGSGSVLTVMPSGEFTLAEYSRASGIPAAEFCPASAERVRKACASRAQPAVVNVNHRPLDA
jgi:hypothetical protein